MRQQTGGLTPEVLLSITTWEMAGEVVLQCLYRGQPVHHLSLHVRPNLIGFNGWGGTHFTSLPVSERQRNDSRLPLFSFQEQAFSGAQLLARLRQLPRAKWGRGEWQNDSTYWIESERNDLKQASHITLKGGAQLDGIVLHQNQGRLICVHSYHELMTVGHDGKVLAQEFEKIAGEYLDIYLGRDNRDGDFFFLRQGESVLISLIKKDFHDSNVLGVFSVRGAT